MKTMIFRKGHDAYVSNGVYLIDETYWISIWSFKKMFDIDSNNNLKNKLDSAAMTHAYNGEFKLMIPDIGKFETVKGFRKEHLMDFYNITE